MGNAVRIYVFQILILAGAVALSTSGRAADVTTPTLFTVHISSESGQPVPGAEVMLLVETERMASTPSAGKWKPVQNGIVQLSADDNNLLSDEGNSVTKYDIVTRAPGFAPAFETIEAATLSADKAKDVNISLKQGKQVVVQLVPPKDKKLPSDLKPWIIPEQYVPATWSRKSNQELQDPVNVAVTEAKADGKYAFNLAEDSPPVYLMINYPGFLQAWQPAEPIPTTGTLDAPARFELPEPINVQVRFDNPYAAEVGPDVKPVLEVGVSHMMPKKSNWLTQAASYENPPGSRTWQVSDLPPAAYTFAVEEGRVESRNSASHDVGAGETKTVELSAHSVIPQVIVTDEDGRPLADAEGRLSSRSNMFGGSHGWTKMKNGAISFDRSSMQGRYAGDKPVSEFTLEVRAPDYAFAKRDIICGGLDVEPVKIKLNHGQKIILAITTEGKRPVPSDIVPLILSEDQFPRALSYLWRPDNAPTMGVARHIDGDKFEFNIPSETKSFRVALNKKGFIGNYWTEPIIDFDSQPISIVLPQTGSIKVEANLTSPPLAGKDAGLDDQYYVQVNQVVKTGSSALQISATSEMIFESTTTLVNDLPPGEYEVSVHPRMARDTNKQSVSVKSDETTTIKFTVDPRDPNMDRFGRVAAKFPKLIVKDVEGKPVATAEAVVRKKSSRYLPTLKWQKAGGDGIVIPQMEANSETTEGTYEIVVRAQGHVSTAIDINLPDTAGTIPVQLPKGTQVELKLVTEDGREIPKDLTPSVFPENWGRDVWLTVQPHEDNVYAPETLLSPVAVTSNKPGSYHLNLDEKSTAPLYVLINQPGFLKAFQAGPFDAAEWITSGSVEVRLPKPAILTGRWDSNGEKPANPDVTMTIYRSQKVPGTTTWSLRVSKFEAPATSATIAASDLAPGEYSFKAVNGTGTDIYGGEVFSGSDSATLDSGESETLTVVYAPFKREWLEGPFTAKIKVTDQSGNPASGKPYKLTWYASGYPQQTVAEGTVPDNGEIVIKNLAGVEKSMTRDEMKKLPAMPSFSFTVGEQSLGSISFFIYKDGKYEPLQGGAKEKEFDFKIPPAEGDTAPDFAMIDLVTSKTIHLSDFKGQVVLIDFWATWCGPCQGPMAENQEIMRKHKKDWDGKAVILALSIDDEMDTVLKHLDKNDWHETRNVWAAPDPNDPDRTGWKAPAAQLYGINSIPTMMIIDKDGVIKKRGHLSDIENELEQVLQR